MVSRAKAKEAKQKADLRRQPSHKKLQQTTRDAMEFHTPDKQNEYFAPPANDSLIHTANGVAHIIFEVDAAADAHVGLFPRALAAGAVAPWVVNSDMVQLCLGGWGNTISVIRKRKYIPHCVKAIFVGRVVERGQSSRWSFSEASRWSLRETREAFQRCQFRERPRW